MHEVIKLGCLMMLSAILAGASAFQTSIPNKRDFSGRWQVEFTLSGVGAKQLEFDAQAKGSGSFLLQDVAVDDKNRLHRLPATWSQTTNDRVNFSGEVEMQLGTCCRDTGTLIFKGTFKSSNSIAGTAIFITSTFDEQNSVGYISTVGAFTATRARDPR